MTASPSTRRWRVLQVLNCDVDLGRSDEDCLRRPSTTGSRIVDSARPIGINHATATGYSVSALVRKGLRVVASRYYSGRRPPSTGLFESTDTKLGDESALFRDLEG